MSSVNSLNTSELKGIKQLYDKNLDTLANIRTKQVSDLESAAE